MKITVSRLEIEQCVRVLVDRKEYAAERLYGFTALTDKHSDVEDVAADEKAVESFGDFAGIGHPNTMNREICNAFDKLKTIAKTFVSTADDGWGFELEITI